jgi:hypothetical protein
MADYFPLILQAVAGLENNDPENRRALYGRARVALVEQLREITPPLSDMELIREQIELENAIKMVDAGYSPRPAAPKGGAKVADEQIAPMPKLFPKSTD